jgi:hypothetical protein
MSKTILIPTDFSIESLNLLKEAARTAGDEASRMVLVYGVYLPDSIIDLLFFSKQRLIQELSNKDFEDACRIIQNKYHSQIRAVQVELFTGTTQAAFQGFVEGLGVDHVFVPKNYALKINTSRSFNTMPYIRRSGLAITEVSWASLNHVPEKDLLAELFHHDIETRAMGAS